MNTQFNSNVIWLQLEYKISTLVNRPLNSIARRFGCHFLGGVPTKFIDFSIYHLYFALVKFATQWADQGLNKNCPALIGLMKHPR